MRINTVLLAGFAAIALPGFITAGQVTFMNWQRVRLAEDAALASRVVSSAQRAHTAFALESGFINLAAQSAHPDPAALQASAMETDRLLQAARESVAAAGLPADNLAVVTTAIATLRGRLQTIIAQNESKRDPGFGREVLTVREKAGDVLIGLEQQAARRVSVEEPSLSPLLEASEQLMDVRDALGRRNIVLTNWIAGQAIKPAEMAVVDGLTYRMSHSWESASRQFNIIGGPPSLIQEKERQQEIFVKQNEPRWQKVIELARAGATSDPAWPKDAISYRGWTTPALAEIVKLRDLVLDAAVERSGLLLAEAEWRMLIAIGLVGVTIACLAGVVVLLRRRVVRPLSRITQAVELLAAGDLEADVSERDRRDEVGAVARAVQTLKEGALKAREAEAEQAEARSRRAAEDARVREEAAASAAAAAASLVVGSIGAALERLAAGDLTFRLDTPLPEAYEQLRLNLNTAMEELHALVRNIVANTSMIHAGTEEITKAADDLSQRTERQAATLEQTAAALDQITATVRKTAEGASHARAVVAKTRDGAEQSGSVVEKAVTAMACIEQSSKQVSQIIGVIDEIAFQTNLLALNAGVEAARAGEAGRGFAVVASEVRALAQRSASAAREIKGLISTSAQQVGDGVKLVGDTGQALKRMVAQVTEINAVIADIAASAQEQATGLHEVNTAINQMDQVTQQNAAMVEQTTAASHSLEKEAVELTHLTARFQVGEATSAGVPATAARPQPKTTVPPARKPRAAPVQGNTATARKLAPAENEWEEF